jgi:20S proteasome alpha/beta subunit
MFFAAYNVYVKTYLLTIYYDSQLNKNDYYNDFICLNSARILTCIIGARGADGCVIISDTRQMEDNEAMNVSKVYPLWGNKAAMACAGDGRLIDKLRELVSGKPPTFPQPVKTVEDDVNELRKDYAERIVAVNNKYALRTIFMGLQEFDKKPYIRLIYDDGVSRNIERYCIIGHGANYVKILFNLLYDKMLTVNELAVLGYFCIETLVSSELDQTVGTSQMGPDVMILKDKEEPKSLDPRGPDFNTAKISLQSLQFKYKLVKSIWNEIPQAFENADKNML